MRTREAQERGGDWIPERAVPGAKEPPCRSGAGRTGASIRSSFREDSGGRATHRNPAPAWPELLLDTHCVGARALLSARGAWGPLTPSSRSFLSQEVADFTPPPRGGAAAQLMEALRRAHAASGKARGRPQLAVP